MEDMDGAVEALMHLDTKMRIAEPLLTRGDVDDELAEVDGVVIADRATELEAEHLMVGALFRPGQVRRHRIRRWNAEAAVVAGQIALQDDVSRFPRGRIGEAQLAAQAILKGAPEAFHTTLRLG